MHPRQLLDRLAHGQLANVRFKDAQRLVEVLGFELDRVQGSHHIYRHPVIAQRINLQARGGEAKPHQLRQLLDLMERYALGLKEEGQ